MAKQGSHCEEVTVGTEAGAKNRTKIDGSWGGWMGVGSRKQNKGLL